MKQSWFVPFAPCYYLRIPNMANLSMFFWPVSQRLVGPLTGQCKFVPPRGLGSLQGGRDNAANSTASLDQAVAWSLHDTNPDSVPKPLPRSTSGVCLRILYIRGTGLFHTYLHQLRSVQASTFCIVSAPL